MENIKLFIYFLLRKIRLYCVLDYGLFSIECIRHRKQNQHFIKNHPDFSVPPLQLAFDAYHSVDYEYYFNIGKCQAEYFRNTVTPYLPNEMPLSILDWGCGPGRIIRHMGTGWSKDQKITCYGVDYNPDTIKWCQKHIPEINFSKNELAPPLQFDTNSFDVVVARSVFTHLSETMHDAWLQELHRVLKPGGLLLATLHGDHFESKMTKSERQAYQEGNIVVRDAAKGREKRVHCLPPNAVFAQAI